METVTLEQMSYLAQIIGVFAVVASLIYVGKQIQQNVIQMRINTADEQTKWSNEVISWIFNNREVADLWIKGNSEVDNLDEVDKQRILVFEIAAINTWHLFFNLRQQNLMSDERWNYQVWAFKYFGNRQSTREAWKITKESYDKPYQDFMSQYLE